jgi:RHS repeat-associated protein
VEKSGPGGTTLYCYDPWGDVLSETDAAGNMQFEYVYINGRRIVKATPGANGTAYLYFSDGLGSARVITNVNGGIFEDSDYLPFGQEISRTNTCSQNYRFTGKERDSESGNGNFGARYYGNNFGRFLSPDPDSAGAEQSDPQSWNGYAYVGNNPATLTDPNGQDYYILGGDECGQDNVNCDKQGYVLDSSGNRAVITDQQVLNGSVGIGTDKNGNATLTTGQAGSAEFRLLKLCGTFRHFQN